MFDFLQNRNLAFWHILKIAVFWVVFGIFITGVYHLHEKSADLKNEREKRSQNLVRLLDDKKELEAGIAFLQSESALEREAKSRLNYKKIGEEVVVVVPEEKPTSSAPLESTTLFYSIQKMFSQWLQFR